MPTGDSGCAGVTINDAGDILGTCNTYVGKNDKIAGYKLFSFNTASCARDLGIIVGGVNVDFTFNVNAHGEFAVTEDDFVGDVFSTYFGALGNGNSIKRIFATRTVNGYTIPSTADWLNDFGDIVGTTSQVGSPFITTGYFIKSGHLSLISPPFGFYTFVSGINNSDEVVGRYHATIGQDVMYLTGLSLKYIGGIDDHGDVLGSDYQGGRLGKWYLLKQE